MTPTTPAPSVKGRPHRPDRTPGDTSAEFEEWVRPHWSALVRLAKRLCPAEPEDLLQDTVARAWERRDAYDAARGTARSWLCALMMDRARASLRSARRRPPLNLVGSVLDAVAGDPGRPPSDTWLDLEREIRVLSRRQREVIELYYFIDLPIAEIAVVLGISAGTVKSTLADARRTLSRALDADGTT